MSRENDDNPIGWRSIYPDGDRSGGDDDRRQDENAAREEDAGPADESAPADAPRLPDEPFVPEARQMADAGQEPAAPKPSGETKARPPGERPDVGYPREFRSAQEEEKPGKRKAKASAPSDAEAEAEASKPAVRYRRKKGHPLLWSFLIAVGLVVVGVGSVLFYVWNGLRPTSASEAPVRVTIKSGSSANDVSEVLEESGLVRNAYLFSAWLKLKDEGSKFQAGEYDMKPGMTREEIVAMLNAGDTVAVETIKFTIPEGFTVGQIADRLVKEAGIDRDKFLKAMSDPAVLNASMWTKQIPLDASMKYPLEGYLFPETYEMKKGSTEADLINRMVSELDIKLGQLPEDWQSVMEERGLTLHQVLTIASLIEREVVLDSERAKVASVIENRLEQKMPLQIDATIQYALGKQKEKLTTDDLKIESPYNTYLHPGLPPGPIANPSIKSIEAALYPEDTDYLYYVTKKDGSNEHLFATTYKQHQQNIQQSEQNEKKAQKK